VTNLAEPLHPPLSLFLCCGNGGGGDPPTGGNGAWDQPEIDTLLARQAELVALATSGNATSANTLTELQAISAALGALNPLTSEQLASVLGASSLGTPSTPFPTTNSSGFATALSTKLPSPELTASGSGDSTFVVPFVMPGATSANVTIELNPDNWPATPVLDTLDTLRGVVRSMLALVLGYVLLSNIWKALRQY